MWSAQDSGAERRSLQPRVRPDPRRLRCPSPHRQEVHQFLGTQARARVLHGHHPPVLGAGSAARAVTNTRGARNVG